MNQFDKNILRTIRNEHPMLNASRFAWWLIDHDQRLVISLLRGLVQEVDQEILNPPEVKATTSKRGKR